MEFLSLEGEKRKISVKHYQIESNEDDVNNPSRPSVKETGNGTAHIWSEEYAQEPSTVPLRQSSECQRKRRVKRN